MSTCQVHKPRKRLPTRIHLGMPWHIRIHSVMTGYVRGLGVLAMLNVVLAPAPRNGGALPETKTRPNQHERCIYGTCFFCFLAKVHPNAVRSDSIDDILGFIYGPKRTQVYPLKFKATQVLGLGGSRVYLGFPGPSHSKLSPNALRR
jgi:hypothetical protein